MSRKPRGHLTVTGRWAKHLRPLFRRAFWKGERQAEQAHIRAERLDVDDGCTAGTTHVVPGAGIRRPARLSPQRSRPAGY
jgi:hypothetical protein